MIRVTLYSTLRPYASDRDVDEPLYVSYKPGMTIRVLITRLGIAEEKEVMLFAVNDEVKKLNYDYPLQDGDRVKLFGLVSGG